MALSPVSRAMKTRPVSVWSTLLFVGCAALCGASSGCQVSVGGQTLPSAYYLKDDLQYFPAGPEFKLSNQARAIEEYKLRQQGLTDVPAQ